MLRMDQVHVIRHKVLVEGKSIRQTAREMGVSRNTVRKYLKVSEPRRVEKVPRPRPVLEAVKPRLGEIIEEWSHRTTKKQRITATRLHRQLVEEGFRVGITTVKDYVREWKRQRAEVFIPLVHRPGEAQVDFFDVTVEVGRERRRAWKFVLRLMFSGRDFVWLYDRADQVSLLDGHVRAFEHFGGHPSKIVYDNLKPVVKKVLVKGRELTEGFCRFTSHYPFEPLFARPGQGHDKGGVEGRGKNLRLQHLVPIPRGASLDAISQRVMADIDADLGRSRDRHGPSVEQLFAKEKPLLKPLPAPFDVRKLVPVTVSSKSLVRIEGVEYSVPSTWARLPARAYAGVREIEVVCRGESVRIERELLKTRKVSYRHYLPELARKPQAVRQVAPEIVAELGEPFGRFWTVLDKTHGAQKASRILAAVLAAVLEHGETEVAEAIQETLEAGQTDLLTVMSRLERQDDLPLSEVPPSLAAYPIEQASCRDYDYLLLESSTKGA